MRIPLSLKFGLPVLLVMVISGCFTKQPPPPAELAAKVLASEHLNPNADGIASPIVVRLYELKSTANFDDSDFFSLYDDDTSALGADLVAKDEFRFKPGEERQIHRQLDPGTRFIGVLAAYRDLEGSTWRASTPIQEHRVNAYTLLLDRNEVSITQTAAAKQ